MCCRGLGRWRFSGCLDFLAVWYPHSVRTHPLSLACRLTVRRLPAYQIVEQKLSTCPPCLISLGWKFRIFGIEPKSQVSAVMSQLGADRQMKGPDGTLGLTALCTEVDPQIQFHPYEKSQSVPTRWTSITPTLGFILGTIHRTWNIGRPL